MNLLMRLFKQPSFSNNGNGAVPSLDLSDNDMPHGDILFFDSSVIYSSIPSLDRVPPSSIVSRDID